MNNRGLLGPWKPMRKAALFSMIATGLSLFFLAAVPLGLVALGGLYMAALIWRDLIMLDPTDGTYIPGTKPFKVATFFMALKPTFTSTLSDVYQMAFGPGKADQDHGYEPGFFPATRLSSWFSLLLAVVLSYIDYLFASLHMVVVPYLWVLLVPISAVGWFLTFQVTLATFAMQGSRDTVMSVEAKPQLILSAIKDPTGGLEMKSVVIKACGIALAMSLVTFIIAASTGVPWWVTLIIIGIEVFASLLISMSRDLQQQYIAPWEARKERREFWEGVWGFMKPEQIPQLLAESDLPSLEEWERDHTHDDGSVDPYDPSVKIAVMSIPQFQQFKDYLGYEEVLRGSIPDCKSLAVAPVGEFTDQGTEKIGSVGTQAFRIWYSVKETPKLLDLTIDSRMRELVCRSQVVNSLRQIKAIGECLYYKALPVTKNESATKIIAVHVVPQNPSVNEEVFLRSIPEIQTILGVEWVRVMASREKAAPNGTMILYIADQEPRPNSVVYINPASIEQKKIDEMAWLYNFHATKIKGESGYPTYIGREKTTSLVSKVSFVIPDGLEIDDIKKVAKRLASASGNGFLEINNRPATGAVVEETTTDRNGRVRRLSRREIQQQIVEDKSRFDIVAAKTDPLNRPFLFRDYRDQILTGRVPGVAKLKWAAGVLADDELAWDNWDSASGSHLLVAGQSGSGKSVTMTDMILQLVYNNGPSELRFWMIEPKNEMQVYRDCDVVQEFVDSFTPGDFMTNAADLMEKLVEEMNRRNEVMVAHPKAPKKLSKAREIAQTESAANGTPLEDHPLYMPFIIMIVEECATLFAEASNAEEKAEQKRLITATAEIARKARSAGIYLVAATQYPTNASIPSVIRQQMRRIGMKCRDTISSQVVIGEPGLENVSILGAGKLEPEGSYEYRMFRSFFAMDGDPDKGEHNDIFDVLKDVPTHVGMSPNQLGGKSKAKEMLMPDISDTVFSRFESISGKRLQEAIDAGRQTRDISVDSSGMLVL